ncbi:helix-turn-helix transcriptional regulator [Actinomadura graeca]|uniref:Helix-turn-helix transcriptional regulator n=1 Tax=Actinomadura graeca TaxID=2750812 RepID=A0ABX8R456_9ACTN|nr:helix-turn-helix transcriptional regulator [Actinomadura graeca]QXJ25851.1 helix-turn-helix transcriptional regulator [Actinomadura graeca]
MAEQAGDRVCPACRITRLSRYNPDPLCGACLVAVRNGTGVTPLWLWDSVPLRNALARVDMAAVMAILRGAARMSQLDFGHILGWSQSVVTKIERRKRDTFHDIREIVRVADLLDMPRQALLPLVTGCADSRLVTDQDTAFWEDAMEPLARMGRRGFNVMISGLALAAVVPPDRIDRGHIRYLQASLERLRGQAASIGGMPLRTQATRLFSRARAMLDESDYTEQVGRELLVVTADLALVTGWLAYDSGDQACARAFYTEAATLAGGADDAQLLVHIYANMAQQSTYLARATGNRGAAREALRFLDRAADSARYLPSPTLQALLALRRALPHAQLGDATAYKTAIAKARRDIDRGPHDSDQPWTAFISHSEITGHEAMAAQYDRPGHAAELYRSVLKDTARTPHDLAFYSAALAGALCSAGDHRGAITQGLHVVDGLGNTMSSMRVLDRLRPIRDIVGPPIPDDAQEFCRQFDTAARTLTVAAA